MNVLSNSLRPFTRSATNWISWPAFLLTISASSGWRGSFVASCGWWIEAAIA